MSPEQVGAWAAIGGLLLTLFGGIASAYFHLVMHGIEKDQKALEERIKGLVEKKDALEANISKNKEALESKIAALEREAIKREELDRFKADMDKLGDRIVSSVEALGNKVEHLLERVAKVEAAS